MATKKKVSLDAIDSILGGVEEPQEQTTNVEPATASKPSRGRPKETDYEARTFRVKKELVQKLRIIAQTEGTLQKDLLDFALENLVSRYEEKHGAIDLSLATEKKNLAEIF